MPTIAELSAKNAALTASGQKVYSEPETPQSPQTPGSMPNQTQSGLPVRGVFNPDQILATDFHNTTKTDGVPQRSTIFPPQAANPTSTKTTVVVGSGGGSSASSLEISTNNLANPVQDKINFLGAGGITITSDGAGNEIFTGSPGSGDGLVHGDPIWDVDSAYVWLRDDFNTGTASGGTIGDLRWDAASTGGTTTQFTGTPPHLGTFRITNSGSSDDFYSITLPSNTVSPYDTAWDLLNNPGWKMVWTWRWTDQPGASPSLGGYFNMAQKSFYVGLGMSKTTPLVRPDIFIGARYDADTTSPAIADTTIKLEAVFNTLGNSRNNTQGTVVDTGITPVDDAWYRLEITCVEVGVVVMSINGATISTFTLTPITVTASGSGSAQAGNGLGAVTATTSTMPWAAGTQVTLAGMTVYAALNGTHVLKAGDSLGPLIFASAATIGNGNTAFTATGYPSLYAFCNWGNDTEATPAIDTSLEIDFFAFVWNSGLATAPLALDSTSPRWDAGS